MTVAHGKSTCIVRLLTITVCNYGSMLTIALLDVAILILQFL